MLGVFLAIYFMLLSINSKKSRKNIPSCTLVSLANNDHNNNGMDIQVSQSH